jgi:hypothetical protein
MFLPAALVKHVLMPLLDVKSTEALERASKSVYASMQARDSLRAYDCLKIVHRDVQAAVQQQGIDVQAALQYIEDAIARNTLGLPVQDFSKNEVLYKQGWALKFMHYVWAYYAAQEGRGFAPFDIENVERIYEWLDMEVPLCLHTAFARF